MKTVLISGIVIILISLMPGPARAQLNVEKHVIDGGINGAYWITVNGNDIAAAATGGTLRFYNGNGSGSFSTQTVGSLSGAWSIHSEDIDGDGDLDFVASSPATDEVVFYERTGGGFARHVIDDQGQDPESVFAADYDDDGDIDIAAALWESQQIAWYENRGNDNFVKHILESNMPGAHSVHGADVDRDGDTDLLGSGSNQSYWWRNNGGGSFSKSALASNGSWCVFAVDMDGDGDKDVLRTQRNNGDVDWLRNSGGSFSEQNVAPAFGECWAVSGGDIDGDGDTDVAAAGFDNGNVVVWLNDGNGNFDEVEIDSGLRRTRGIGVGDFDGDGDADVAAGLSNAGQVVWYEILGGGGGTPATITLTAPNGGENLTAGETFNIQWTSSGSIANVKIEFSTNGGGSWTAITASTANDGSQNWTVPDVSSSNCLVLISDASDGSPSDISNGSFTITGSPVSVTLTSPNGGESWTAGTSQQITWTSTGTIANVKLEYSLNNGGSWNNIIASTNDGSQNWNIPAAQSDNALVRVSDASNSAINDASDDVFSIVAGAAASLTLTSPNGGETLNAGTTHQITWTSTGSIANVKLEYSLDNGGSWNNIIASTGNDGSQNWNIPALQSENALVRVSDASNSAINDVSDDVFVIISSGPASLTLLSPNGDEKLTAGSTQPITWTSTGSIANVKLEYSLNNGSSWATISSSTGNDGSFNWNVPALQSFTALVRISDASNSAINDVSDGTFSILPLVDPLITITSPNGGEIWIMGSEHDVTWTAPASIANVKLQYSLDSGENWTTFKASTLNDGVYGWVLPNTESHDALIRVLDAANASVFDISDGVFSVVPEGTPTATLTLTAPNGGEGWTAGTSQQITWISTGTIATVKLEYSLDNGSSWTIISSSTNNDGAFNWNIPTVESDSALVRISDASNSSIHDVSNGVFSIVTPIKLTLTSPNGGETWTAGSSQQINWTSTGAIASVKLEYSLDNGGSWTTIDNGVNNDGDFNWSIPAVVSDSALVRISDAANATVSDVSDSLFRIVAAPGLTVTSPNGGEVWYTGQRETITWNSTGDFLEVRIEYSLDNGRNWIVLRNDAENDGSFNWIPPTEAKSDSALVRVSAANNQNIFDVSDSVFTIDTKTLTLTAPNGGETWFAGSSQMISWTTYGPIDSVELEFSLNNGAGWEKIAEIKNTGSYDWLLPSTTSDSALVRINGITDSTAADISDSVFRITESVLTLTTPNGGEVWMTGSEHAITWSSGGDIDSVKIEYSLDHGNSWTTISASAPNTGRYDWVLPATESNTALIYISAADDNSPSDLSDSLFTIATEILTVISPNGGEIWESGHSYEIDWNGSETITAVTLEYSPDNGETWISIADNVVNTGKYEWDIPAINTDSVRVRVSDASDGAPADVSDGNFTITIIDGVVDAEPTIPEQFELLQNYPNPFNIETKIVFAVPQTSSIVLSIYNTKGERIRTLQAGQLAPGRYTSLWDGRNDAGQVVATGFYIYRIQMGEWQASRKMSLIK